jgi:glutathione peroxidase
MKWQTCLTALVLASLAVFVVADDAKKPAGPLDFKVKDIKGAETDLSQYKGKVVLIVNTATKCGLKKQIGTLETVYDKYGKDGLVVIGFPSGDFKNQEEEDNAKIQEVCEKTYKVTYPLMSKVSVLGEKKEPIYAWLTSKDSNPKFGGDLKWNYTKFLIGRDGQVVARFEPKVLPDSEEVTKTIEAELAKK